jgi:hypothetical protein
MAKAKKANPNNPFVPNEQDFDGPPMSTRSPAGNIYRTVPLEDGEDEAAKVIAKQTKGALK